MNGADHQTTTIEQKWQRIAEEARSEAKTMPPCEKRESLLKKARQLEVAMTLNNWLSAPSSK